jgi:hypothetical protein
MKFRRDPYSSNISSSSRRVSTILYFTSDKEKNDIHLTEFWTRTNGAEENHSCPYQELSPSYYTNSAIGILVHDQYNWLSAIK